MTDSFFFVQRASRPRRLHGSAGRPATPLLRTALLSSALVAVALATAPGAWAQAQGAAAVRPARSLPNTADFIVAVVNQELVTNAELQQRIASIREDGARARTALPPESELRRQVLDALINDRVQVTNAREYGPRIDEAELDRAVENVALQNQLSMTQLRERLRQQGIDYSKFRSNIRDQLQVERLREKEVNARIRINNDEIDALLDRHRAQSGKSVQVNLAQILVTVPDGASTAEVEARRQRAEQALARVKSGERFETVAREISEDGNRAAGGVIGLRPADRLPDVFVDATRSLKTGEVTPSLLRSGAGFHVLKVIERTEPSAYVIQQTHARHILLRTSPQLTQEAAVRRLAGFKREILAGSKTFEQLAKDNSEDSSAERGGDLGWASPGLFVPEFEDAMKALPIDGLSDPVISRFGVHLIQVVERRQTVLDAKQQREQARNELRELKFEEAYVDWLRDLRGRAYVEMREPPQ